MDSKDYTSLLRELEEGTCALILGPEFFSLNNKDNKEESILESLRDTIYKDKLKDTPYLAEDGFFYAQKNNKNKQIKDNKDIVQSVKEYYGELKVPDYYNLLAQLPFYMVISLSPDDLLSKAMNSIKRPYDFLYFKKGTGVYLRKKNEETNSMEMTMVQDLAITPRPEHPLLFNFMGIYDDRDSIIFTYDSLFEFLYSIFPVTNLPLFLLTAIKKATSFLFLGFGYDKWYLKIIFFTLEKMLGDTETEKKAIFNYRDTQNKIVEFYESQFLMQFFKQGTLAFIKDLQNDCKTKVIPRPIDSSRSTVERKEKKYKILYFSANPEQLNPLDFESEFKKIKEGLIRKPNRDDFDLADWHPATSQKEMIKTINEELPNLVVISMHGSQSEGLLFKNEDGTRAPLSLDDFIKDIQVLTQNPSNRLECILFSCCNSREFAEAVSTYVPFAIGMEGPIQDEAMPEFNEGFFDTLFNKKDIPYAYEMGLRFIERKPNLKKNAPLVKRYPTKV
jgi:SIR2-like protein